MRYVRIILPIVLLIFTSLLQGQGVDDRAKNKAKTKTNNRIDNKVDQGLDKGLNAVEGLFKKKDKKSRSDEPEVIETQASEPSNAEVPSKTHESNSGAGQGAGMFGSMFEKAVWEDSYRFTFTSTAHITSTSKKGKVEENDMEWMIGDNAMGMVVVDPKKKNPDGMIIFDYTNHSFITLTEDDGKKQGMALAMNKDQLSMTMEETMAEETTGTGNFTKTGKTKTILGYTCYEYIFSDEEMKGEMWMTPDVSLNMENLFGMMTQGNKSSAKMPDNYPKGYAMEMHSTDLKKGDKSDYLVTAIDDNANIDFDLKPYNVMDPMSSLSAPRD